MRLDHKERASEEVMMVAMVLASVSGNHSLGGGGGKSTCSNTEIYCTILIQALQEQTCLQQRWWKKAKITLNISVGYNCQEWLINRAVHHVPLSLWVNVFASR